MTKLEMKAKQLKSAKSKGLTQVCAYCQKPFVQSDYGLLCDAIMGQKPACSPECRQALG